MFYNFSFACKASEIKKALKKIIQFQIVEMTMDDHDCHNGPEDGCQGCHQIEELKTYLNKSL